MRPGWLAPPMLIAMAACSPVREYQAAARSVRFSLDRVDPRIELAFPLERSRILFDLTLGVENPSARPFHILGFDGSLRLETAGTPQPLGRLELLRALDLPAGGKAELAVAVSFAYQDLAGRWPEIQAALQGERSGEWSLEGTLRAEVYGIPIQVPVTAHRSFGAAP